jgi:hypothetical protein
MAQSTTNRDQVEPEPERTKDSSSELTAQFSRDDPSPPDWLSLDEHEEFLWKDSPSFKIFLPDLGMTVVIVGIGAILAGIGALQLFDEFPSSVQLAILATGGILMAIGIGFFIFNYYFYRRRQYAITTKAIYRRWDDSTTEIEITDICEVLCEQSWSDRQFSCGDLRIGSSKDGTEKTTYPAVPRPNRVKKRLLDLAQRDD